MARMSDAGLRAVRARGRCRGEGVGQRERDKHRRTERQTSVRREPTSDHRATGEASLPSAQRSEGAGELERRRKRSHAAMHARPR